MGIDFFIQLVINGLLLGAFYATMALGFSIIWGVMRLINLAHGEFLMMGAFVAWFFFNPDRPQDLIIAADAETTYVTPIALVIFGIILGGLIAEFAVGEDRLPNKLVRRGAGMLSGVVGAIVIFLIWQAAAFTDVTISMFNMIYFGLILSIGFIVSHIVLNKIMAYGTLNQRRTIGYGSGIVVATVLRLVWAASGNTPIDPFLSLPILFVLFFALGYVLQNSFLNRLIGGPYLTMLLVTFAISIMLQNFGLLIYKADPRRINLEYGNAINLFGSITVPPTRVIMVVIAVVMIAGLVAFLRFTRTGYAIRAAAQNEMAARLMGIDINEVYAITFGISLALTAMAGAMMGTFQPITPVDGPVFTLRAFSIVALGGLGKVEGVVVGGLALGLAESLVGGYINTGWAIAVAFILLVFMLVVRPQGITGGLVASEE